jgi:tetratricopeptide (TPR) repeat protein
MVVWKKSMAVFRGDSEGRRPKTDGKGGNSYQIPDCFQQLPLAAVYDGEWKRQNWLAVAWGSRKSCWDILVVTLRQRDMMTLLDMLLAAAGRTLKGGKGFAAVWLLSVGCALGAAPAGSFEAANKLYEQGQYVAAVAAYDQMVAQGEVSAAIYFNLGNACFKASQIGRAIAAYRQAEMLAPRDPDIRANLQFARRAVTGKDDAGPKGWARWLGRLTLNEWAVLAGIWLWLWLGLLAAGQWRTAWRKGLRPYALLSLALLLGCAGCLGRLAYERYGRAQAVVAVRDAPARMGPLEESKPAFTLADGAEVEILGVKDNWREVRDGAQRVGWLKTDQLLPFPARKKL